jgi:hypothetical protein
MLRDRGVADGFHDILPELETVSKELGMDLPTTFFRPATKKLPAP